MILDPFGDCFTAFAMTEGNVAGWFRGDLLCSTAFYLIRIGDNLKVICLFPFQAIGAGIPFLKTGDIIFYSWLLTGMRIDRISFRLSD